MTPRQLEIEQLQATKTLITKEQALLKEILNEHATSLKQASLENGTDENRINAFSQESLWESYFARRQHEQDLLIRYHSVEAQKKRQQTLSVMDNNPYFARIDFHEGQEENSLYIGIASLRDENEETFVVDWRSPIANLYYESELGPAFYESQGDRYDVDLFLKRQFKIVDGRLISMVDTSETINDDFLLEILDENSNNHMKNIVATIQKAQNAIIRNTTSQVMMIEGIAGSGKTSALMQRIAYLLYVNRNWLDTEQVLLFSPNHLFSEYIADVLPSLGESQIPTETFLSYYQQLLPKLTIVKKSGGEKDFLQGVKSPATQMKADLAFISYLDAYLEQIKERGPLFVDLKIQGEIVISKEQIRNYYQETNPNLAVHQRVSLLQTKLQKKLGGLMKDEQKKDWVKDMVHDKIQEVFENNLQLEDTPENERKIRQQISKGIVSKYFRKTKRKINNFNFVAFHRQYLHFLQVLPESFLNTYGITKDTWQKERENLRQSLMNKELPMEDAPLYLLLKKRLAPFYLEKKARYVFVDEMQDVTPMEAAFLRELHEKGNFTFCGDLNQQIFGNQTLVTTIDTIFPDKRLEKFQLTTSYRSTKEITAFAESFLKEYKGTSAPRNGALPQVTLKDDKEELFTALVKDLKVEKTAHVKRQAILTKTIDEAKALMTQFENTDFDPQLIIKEDDFFKRSLVILPAFLAKGLEFDEVYLYNISNENFQTDSDRLVLYTMITRGMHQVYLYGKNLPFAFGGQEILFEEK